MKLRTKAIALSLALATTAAFGFTACDDEGKAKNPVSTNNEQNEPKTQVEEGMTKEYFEANKYEVLMNSVDFEELFGLDDEVFNFFRNEELKNGAEMSLFISEGSDKATLTASALANPFKLRYDIALDGEDINEMFNGPVNGSVYADADKLSVEFAPVLEDKAAGIEFGNIYDMVKDFSESELAVILEAPSYEEIVGAMDEMGINQETIDEILDRVLEFCEMYCSEQNGIAGEFENAVKEYAEGLLGEVGEAVIDENGKQIPALTLKCEIDNEDILNCIDLVFDLYEEYYVGIGDFADEIAAMAGIEESVPMAIIDETLYALDEMREEIHSAFEMIDIKGTSISYIDKMTGKYIKSDYTIVFTETDENGEFYEDAVITGTEYVADNGIVNEFVIDIDEENTVDVKLDILSESTDKYSLMFAIEAYHRQYDERVSADCGFEIDKTAKEYKLFANATTPEFADAYLVNGSYDYTDDSLSISVDEFCENDEVTEIPLENKITVKVIDDVKPHENFVSIFDLSAMDIIDIMTNIQNM